MIQLDQLHPHGVGPDGLRRWTVRFPDLSYDGKALAPADWTAGQVLDALNLIGKQTSDNVLASRLYSPVNLTPP